MSRKSNLKIKTDPRFTSPMARKAKRLFKGIGGAMSWKQLGKLQACQMQATQIVRQQAATQAEQ